MVAFAWDAEKEKVNFAKHSVSFEQAKDAFRDAFAVEFLDNRFDYGEDRFILIAMANGQCLTVVYVEHDEVCRLISARPSTRAEQDAYFEAQG